ncbi:hypothetical protein QBC34DRAFT_197115 [Podospora aff. communis PSN243]|uniref:Transmembrane protein n=1 Tax=Podospora aff. communis PSN243 TaxID=3040156 RepID=A0AAV9G803_9PEZI|nr:hypothetical protein QBC34DRAFT_197115 [Podospora aff. communis PSN243]
MSLVDDDIDWIMARLGEKHKPKKIKEQKKHNRRTGHVTDRYLWMDRKEHVCTAGFCFWLFVFHIWLYLLQLRHCSCLLFFCSFTSFTGEEFLVTFFGTATM